MAKRFIDTEIFKKPFVKGLGTVYKLFWLYIFTDCDHAGIWQVECDVAAARLGEPIDCDQALEVFGENIQVINSGAQWFLPGFIGFQYGQLNPDVKAHASVIRILEKYLGAKGVKQFIKGSRTLMDKDTDMDKAKDKDMAAALAEMLIEKCEAHLGRKSSTTKAASTKEILVLMRRGVTIDEIGRAIAWLYDAKGNLDRGDYALEVQSGGALKDKFEKIRAAMAKGKPQHQAPDNDQTVQGYVSELIGLKAGSFVNSDISSFFTKVRNAAGPEVANRVDAEYKRQHGNT